MIVKQISVFVENKPGRLSEMTNILKDNGIDIRALSIADTKDFGILRLIVSDPEKACGVLKNADCTVTITDVLAVGVEDKPGGIAKVMDTLFENKISVEYMYAFVSRSEDTAYVILRFADNKHAAEVLTKAGIRLLSSKEIYDM